MSTSFHIDKFPIGRCESRIFIIAEIGQNHQGSLELAKQMITEAKKCGCDCVKFQKSNLNAKFTKSALSRSYCNSNSWGDTYRAHKEYLEFSINEIKQLKIFADNLGIYFSASAMDDISLQELINLNLPFIKIGSGDANNFPLLKIASKLSIPLIISTGMQNISTIDEIYKIMNDNRKKNYSFLHCVSSYPTQPADTNLMIIKLLQERYPNIVIGYSGHEQDTIISQASVLLGAKIIERHFTLNKNLKGTDHKCSLTPNEMANLVQSIRKLENKYYTIDTIKLFDSEMIKTILKTEIQNFSINDENLLELALKDVKSKSILNCELECRHKLGKSLVYKSNFQNGYILNENDIAIKVNEPFGITAERIYEFVGKTLKKSVKFDEPLLENDF